MKCRLGFVSNSSSSSFVIAYDPLFFGNLFEFFKTNYVGCETYVKNSTNLDEFCKYCSDDETQWDQIKQKITDLKNDGKQVIEVQLDKEFWCIITLLDMINESSGGDKLEYLVKGEGFFS